MNSIQGVRLGSPNEDRFDALLKQVFRVKKVPQPLRLRVRPKAQSELEVQARRGVLRIGLVSTTECPHPIKELAIRSPEVQTEALDRSTRSPAGNRNLDLARDAFVVEVGEELIIDSEVWGTYARATSEVFGHHPCRGRRRNRVALRHLEIDWPDPGASPHDELTHDIATRQQGSAGPPARPRPGRRSR